MIERSELLPGDILIQCKGQPWVGAAWLFTGHPYPHSLIVSGVGSAGLIKTYEEGPTGFVQDELGDLSHYVVRRPKCTDELKAAALFWMSLRLGQPYDYFGCLAIASVYRFGFRSRVPDDDKTFDNRPMWCSEIIAMGYYRSGFDPVPHVTNRNTMPWDFVNSPTLEVL